MIAWEVDVSGHIILSLLQPSHDPLVNLSLLQWENEISWLDSKKWKLNSSHIATASHCHSCAASFILLPSSLSNLANGIHFCPRWPALPALPGHGHWLHLCWEDLWQWGVQGHSDSPYLAAGNSWGRWQSGRGKTSHLWQCRWEQPHLYGSLLFIKCWLYLCLRCFFSG